MILDVRQIKVALRGLRQLGRIGPEEELDIDSTIDATARNAGDIDLKWMRSRINSPGSVGATRSRLEARTSPNFGVKRPQP